MSGNIEQRPEPDHIHWLQSPGSGQRLEIGGMAVVIRLVGAASSGTCAVLEMHLPAQFTGHGPHVHHRTTEAYYIISGTVAFTLGAETMIARQGAMVLVRPRTVHEFWNPGAEVARVLVVLTPGGVEQYYLDLAAALADESARPPPAPGMEYDYFPAAG